MTESEVRQLRDVVFGVPSTDHNWEACRENWMRLGSIYWLQTTADHPDAEKTGKACLEALSKETGLPLI